MFEWFVHVGRVLQHALYERYKGLSPYWKACEHDFLLEHPTCAACGGNKNLAVHHVKPFDKLKSLEVDWTNLLTLCMGPHECHFRLAHGTDYMTYCPTVREDAAAVLAQPALRPLMEQKAFDTRLYRNPFA